MQAAKGAGNSAEKDNQGGQIERKGERELPYDDSHPCQ